MANLIIKTNRPRKLHGVVSHWTWRSMSRRAKVIFEFFYDLAEGTSEAIAAGDAKSPCYGFNSQANRGVEGGLHAGGESTINLTTLIGMHGRIECCMNLSDSELGGHPAADGGWEDLKPLFSCGDPISTGECYEHYLAIPVAELLAAEDWKFSEPHLTASDPLGRELDEGGYLPQIPKEIKWHH